MTKAVSSFFEKHHFSVNKADYNLISALRADMNAKLKGEKAWQEMALTWALPPEKSPVNESVIVIDAGGSNFRSCLVTFDGKGNPLVSEFKKSAMPGLERELSKAEFFDAIADKIEYLKNRADRIGFCFSYSMIITREGDGIPNSLSKEIKASEVVGVPVGATLRQVLEKRGWNTISHIALLNDTVAALLAGAAGNNGTYSSYIGFILGTGMNGAYIQPAFGGEKRQIVVCENGKFGNFARSDFDLALDNKSQQPGEYMLQKCCSGGYLGSLGLEVLQTAAGVGLVSPESASALKELKNLTLVEMDEFLHTPGKKENVIAACCKDDGDRNTVFELLDALVERCAGYSASILAACLEQCEEGKNQPVCILCNGTTFYKTYRLKERIESYLSQYADNIRYEIVGMENDITIGTAIAGLL
ncbi:MAG: hexokinase [Treponema sp.]|nr:hexokinase [Treponema sp.]